MINFLLDHCLKKIKQKAIRSTTQRLQELMDAQQDHPIKIMLNNFLQFKTDKNCVQKSNKPQLKINIP